MGVAETPGIAVTGLFRRLFGRGSGPVLSREEMERILLEADFGVRATDSLLERLQRVSPDRLQASLEDVVTGLLGGGDSSAAAGVAPPSADLARAAAPPTVVVIFGVNGVGKTTTIAKLGHRLARQGRSVLLAAADTYRPGATEQLRIWADRLGVACVGGSPGADPAAVAFDALAAAQARGVDTLIVDTAGRLHTEPGLMQELKKIVRVLAKRHPGGDAPHESLLVLDGTVGQNALQQARSFAEAVPLTGLVVTKLDGTAKGGAVVALRQAVLVPIRFIGTGEGLEDLEPFDARTYARRLVAG
jgi:fused signal recognition particle receptor